MTGFPSRVRTFARRAQSASVSRVWTLWAWAAFRPRKTRSRPAYSAAAALRPSLARAIRAATRFPSRA